jgi:hypothetical protein
MPTRRSVIAGAILLAALAMSPAMSIATAAAKPSHPKPDDFRSAMRKLWEDHVTWTRLYIVSAAANLPEKDATAQRLLQNQTDLGNAIKPYYGDGAGSKLTALLKDHIMIATELIDAAQKGDNPKKEDAAKRWNHNADEIAGFLSGANPRNWPLADMKKMMHDHLDLTTAEVVAQLQKDWAGSVAAYDKVHEQILKMADQLAMGIRNQFRAKFAN